MAKKPIDAIRDAGIVGAGGAGFPTHVKLSAKVDTVIVNGAECEPLLKVDQQLTALHAEEVVAGLEIAMELTGAERGIIALKAKYKAAIEALTPLLEGKDNISLDLLGNFYPAGDEQVLVYELLGRIVPEGGIPLEVGVVVQNVGTLINIAKAVKGGVPVTSRALTVAGAVAEPMTVEVPVGTPLRELVAMAGGPTDEPYGVIVGGPMMGKVETDLDTPIDKTTSGIVVLPSDHPLMLKKQDDMSHKLKLARAACIRCSLCTQTCPRSLLGHHLWPDRLMRAMAYNVTCDPSDLTNAFLCVECGVCTTYACPMGLDPCAMNREIKARLAKEGLDNPHRAKDLTPNQYRSTRKIPTYRLVGRLGLLEYDREAPVRAVDHIVRKVRIPLKQHIGAPAKPTVIVGDTVKEGEVIAEIPEGSLGARVHASIAGRVTKILDHIEITAEEK